MSSPVADPAHMAPDPAPCIDQAPPCMLQALVRKPWFVVRMMRDLACTSPVCYSAEAGQWLCAALVILTRVPSILLKKSTRHH